MLNYQSQWLMQAQAWSPAWVGTAVLLLSVHTYCCLKTAGYCRFHRTLSHAAQLPSILCHHLQDGSMFKARVLHAPYFYLQVKVRTIEAAGAFRCPASLTMASSSNQPAGRRLNTGRCTTSTGSWLQSPVPARPCLARGPSQPCASAGGSTARCRLLAAAALRGTLEGH